MPDDLRDQFPKVREVVKALGIPVYEREGFEADDVIGTLTGQAEARGPRDDDRHRRPRHAPARHRADAADDDPLAAACNTVIYDLARIDERFGLRPDQMVDYKALKGDPTDNIPGVPGVGEKTAAKLIATSAPSTRSTSGSTR